MRSNTTYHQQKEPGKINEALVVDEEVCEVSNNDVEEYCTAAGNADLELELCRVLRRWL